LLELADGSLAEADGARVAAHLQGCAACRAEVDELCAFEAGVDVASSADPRTAPDERLRTISERVLGRRRWSVRGVWLSAAAALLAGVLLVLALTREVAPIGSVVAVVRAGPAVRGVVERLVHLEVELRAPAFLAVFEVRHDGGLRLVFPDAVVAPAGAGTPVGPGRYRIPADPLFDFALRAPPPGDYLIVATPTELDSAIWHAIEALPDAAAELTRRFPAVVRVTAR
jgi:hypothetical protein